MKRMIHVHRGEIMAGKGEVVLQSDTGAPCLVIVAHDSIRKIGGLAHAMFRTGSLHKNFHSVVLRDTSAAIDEMISDMTLIGANPEDIKVSLVTGENVHHERGDSDYGQAIHEAVNILREKHIKVEDGGVDNDAEGMHITLDVETGRISF